MNVLAEPWWRDAIRKPTRSPVRGGRHAVLPKGNQVPMRYRRLVEQLRTQSWTAVVIDLVAKRP